MSLTDVIEQDGRRLLVLPEESMLQGRVEIQQQGDQMIVRPAQPSDQRCEAERAAFWSKMDQLRQDEWFEYAGRIDTAAPYFGW